MKKGWSKNRLEKEFKKYELDMDEGVFLAAAIHSVLNQLLRNCSPPAIFANLNCMIESDFINCKTKQYFTKFILYIVEGKLERMITSREYDSLAAINEIDEMIAQKAATIHIDVMNGNKMKLSDIMSFFGVTHEEVIHYLSKNFFPKNWAKYPSELWDLYLQ